MTYPDRRRSVRDLSAAERLAILDRNEYEPTAEYPGAPDLWWPARCLLCGLGVPVTLNNLAEQDHSRNKRNPDVPRRRQRCSHNGGNRSRRPLPPLRHDEAVALLKLAGDLKGDPAPSALKSALNKLKQMVGST